MHKHLKAVLVLLAWVALGGVGAPAFAAWYDSYDVAI